MLFLCYVLILVYAKINVDVDHGEHHIVLSSANCEYFFLYRSQL